MCLLVHAKCDQYFLTYPIHTHELRATLGIKGLCKKLCDETFSLSFDAYAA